jgi:hypothetical protein
METSITKNIEKALKLKINLNDFYNVSFDDCSISLQGKLSTELKKQCELKGFKFELENGHNWLFASKNSIRITLTF